MDYALTLKVLEIVADAVADLTDVVAGRCAEVCRPDKAPVAPEQVWEAPVKPTDPKLFQNESGMKQALNFLLGLRPPLAINNYWTPEAEDAMRAFQRGYPDLLVESGQPCPLTLVTVARALDAA